MNKAEVMKKAESGEGLTVAEIKVYQQMKKPEKHTYGKYGTLAKQYLEEHNWVKMAALGGDLPEYLHGIDKSADDMFETMYARLSSEERFKKTGDFLSDLQKETEIKHLIEEEILNELVYVA
ncbi:MAG: TnpV protein [Clostridia bacterium]|nr:TnpV protein [Clostridia bacterium]